MRAKNRLAVYVAALLLVVTSVVSVACSQRSKESSAQRPAVTATQAVRDRLLLKAGQRIDMPESDVSLVVPAAWEAKMMTFEPLPKGAVAAEMPFGATRGVYVYPLDSGDPRFAKIYTGCPGTSWPDLKDSGTVSHVAPDAYLTDRGVNRIMVEESGDGVRSVLLMVDRRPGAMLIDLALAPSKDGTTTPDAIHAALQDCGLDFPTQ